MSVHTHAFLSEWTTAELAGEPLGAWVGIGQRVRTGA